MTFYGEPPKYTAMYVDQNSAVRSDSVPFENDCWNAVLLEFKKDGARGYFSMVTNPSQVLGIVTTHSGIDHWFGPSGIVVRSSGEDVRIQYDGLYMKCSEFNDRIPFIKNNKLSQIELLNIPYLCCMKVKFGKVVHFNNNDTCMNVRRHIQESVERAAMNFMMRPAPSAPPAAASPSIPKHIARLAILDAISKQEPCVISLEELTPETAVITPCGHVVSRHAAEHWMSSAHSCPVCRAPCSVEQLQHL
jgi:hypothetical protein